MEKYTLDPARITLDEFYRLTRNKELLPGRVLLHEFMEERFSQLSDAGIMHMGSLIKTMRSKEAVLTLSAKTRIPVNYLLLLKRAFLFKGYTILYRICRGYLQNKI